ncbi:MAG: DNA polymerase III subunit delta [Candidatus Omnitrophota bacterium]
MNGIKPHAIYLLAGEEAYLKERFLGLIKSSIFGKQENNIDSDSFKATESRAGEIIDCARTLAFSSGKRLVIIKDPEKFSPQDKELLIEFFKTPPQDTCIVMDTDDGRLLEGFFRSLPKNVQIKKFAKLKHFELKDWLENEIKSRKLKIDAQGINAIEELQGADLGAMSNTLDILKLYAEAKKKALTRDDIERLCGAISAKTGFELVNAIDNKDADSALKILENLSKQGKRYQEIMGILIWYFGRMLKARRLLKEGVSKQEISSKVKVPHYLLEEFLKEVRAVSEDALLKYSDELLETEAAVKTGKIQENLALELCVMKLAGAGF